MKKTILLVISFFILYSCKEAPKKEIVQTKTKLVVTDEMMETAILYEANIRQYSPEGSFKEFTKDIPMLKNELGVKIIWLMPIHPISELKRKATGGSFVSDIKDEKEREKYMGSYYAVSDYRGVSSDYGTIEDLRDLIKVAHENDVHVILDWVPNHTGWDHKWITEHPEFYTKNAAGEITEPLHEDGTSKGWQDVADLNYENEAMRKAMIADMKYWLTEENIDGFRCDVAGEVPLSFWEEAIPELRKFKPLFMLAEAWEPELLKGDLFDMCYGWESHFLWVDIAKGKKTVKNWDQYMVKMDTFYEKDDIIMNFTVNHDENSWKGTITESFGDAAEVMTVLSYVAPGMPLIYSGQEYDLDHRLKFFEKDSIPKTKGKYFALYSKLKELKTENPALHGGKNAASYHRIQTSNDKHILAFTRGKEGEKVSFIANLSDKPQSFTVDLDLELQNFVTDTKEVYKSDQEITLSPWEYKLLIH